MTATPAPRARCSRWLLLVRAVPVLVIAAQMVMVAGGRLDVGPAIGILIAVEAVLLGVVLGVAWVTTRSLRGVPRLEAAVRTVLPRPVAALVLLEPRQLWSLVLLVRGRVATESEQDVPIPYAAGRGGFYGAMGGLAIAELLLVHFLVPWHRFGAFAVLQWVMLALSLYGAVWILSWWASERTHPHLLTPEALVLRTGVLVSLRIPRVLLVGASARLRSDGEEDRLMLTGPGGGTGVDITLSGPVIWTSLSGRRSREIRAVSLEVDDPRDTARILVKSLAGRTPGH